MTASDGTYEQGWQDGATLAVFAPDDPASPARFMGRRFRVGAVEWLDPAPDPAHLASIVARARARAARPIIGKWCEPCERGEHDVCTGYCQGSCCIAYADGQRAALDRAEKALRGLTPSYDALGITLVVPLEDVLDEVASLRPEGHGQQRAQITDADVPEHPSDAQVDAALAVLSEEFNIRTSADVHRFIGGPNDPPQGPLRDAAIAALREADAAQLESIRDIVRRALLAAAAEAAP